MNKEEILDHISVCADDCQSIEDVIPYDKAGAAMDEYAKQQCIAYAHWLFKRILPHMTPQEAPEVEAENLYNKFLTETSI